MTTDVLGTSGFPWMQDLQCGNWESPRVVAELRLIYETGPCGFLDPGSVAQDPVLSARAHLILASS